MRSAHRRRVVRRRRGRCHGRRARAAADSSDQLGARTFTGLVAESVRRRCWSSDRAGWVQANSDAFATHAVTVINKFHREEGRAERLRPGRRLRVTGTEVSLLLGFLASKVLGRSFHEPSGPAAARRPNVVHVEREVEGRPSDFRLWSASTETRRVQFTAAAVATRPPIRAGRWRTPTPGGMLEDGVEPDSRGAARWRAARPRRAELAGAEECLDQVAGVMSLLEGRANIVMDGVGPQVIGSSAKQHASRRRAPGCGVLDRFLRRLLGLNLQDGAVPPNGAKFTVPRRRCAHGQLQHSTRNRPHLPSAEESARAWVRPPAVARVTPRRSAACRRGVRPCDTLKPGDWVVVRVLRGAPTPLALLAATSTRRGTWRCWSWARPSTTGCRSRLGRPRRPSWRQ